jgi:hypothetical protein
MATQDLQKRWLRVTAIVIGAFAPVFFLATMPGFQGPAAFTLDLIGWPVDGAVDLTPPEARLMSALLAGFLMGWGVTIWLLSGAAFDAAPEAVRRAVVAGTLGWFLVDSLGSVTSGHPVNVLFNAAILAFAVGPLWRRAGA